MVAPTQRDRGRRRNWVALAALAILAAAVYASFLVDGPSLRALEFAGIAHLRPAEQEAQDDEGAEEPEVPPDQVQKYINVYKAMQRDHSLTVEQAASRQGMSLEAFRDLESKVERDDLVREHVRQALANPPSDSSAPSAKTTR
ncbi:MAG TPA: hypothetical protein VMB26_07180 [Candidatus Binataceae bacterium]|nr:hypothetical protein [Candidatus Binataceae bacterium]